VASWVAYQTLDQLDFADAASKFRGEEITGNALLASAESGWKDLQLDFQLAVDC
jgi:hypothetical protein